MDDDKDYAGERRLDEILVEHEDFFIGLYGGRRLSRAEKDEIINTIDLRLHEIGCRWRRTRSAAQAVINQTLSRWRQ